MRLRLTFAKTDAMRFTGHLDVYRTLYRTLMRAKLPLTFSQGYNRRPKLVLAGALPLGYTGENEMADLWLDEDIPLEQVITAIEGASSPGLRLRSLEEIDEAVPKVQNQVISADYLVTLLEPLPELVNRIETVLSSETLLRERKGKPYDLRPLILALTFTGNDANGCQQIHMTLQAQESATGRADEVVDVLGGDPHAARYHRLKIHLQ